MTEFCPHCGYDLRQDRPVVIGRASFDPLAGFSYGGVSVDLTAGERIILSTLLKARGAWVSRNALAGRVDTDAAYPGFSVASFIKRIRAKLRAVGADHLIVTGYTLGYRWAAEMAEAA